MKFPRLNFETFGAIGAIILSLAALFVAWDQAVVMRQQQHAAVLPIMTLDLNINQTATENLVELNMSNVGVGPAIIHSAQPMLDGDPLNRWYELAEVLFGDARPATVQLSASSPVSVIRAGEDVTVLGAHWPRSEEEDTILVALARRIGDGTLPRLEMKLCYCSVFEHCWEAGTRDLAYPVPVDSCTRSGDFLETFFLETETPGNNEASQ